MNKNEIKQFLKQRNIHPLKKFGQNFLINRHIIQKIVKSVQRHSPPFVEIGPGLGALSRQFENRKKETFLIERDKKLAVYWKEEGWNVFCIDVLKFKWSDLPNKLTVFGNLPYEIASSLVLQISLQQGQISNMVFMMQKEVAQRIKAKPQTKNYGFLSVISQVFWEIFIVDTVQKTDFYPPPKVEGRILEFQYKNQKEDLPVDLFLKFVKQCFAFKRKMLFKQIPAESEEAKQILRNLGLSESCRAEDLTPSQFIQLYFSVRETAFSVSNKSR